jgi:hypothetical protein
MLNITKQTAEEQSRIDKTAVAYAVKAIVEEKGEFAVPEVRDFLKSQGFTYGDVPELVDYAERQKTRYFIGRLVDKYGKRKYVATQRQMTLDFGNEHIYCPAELVRRESFEEKQTLGWLKKHMIALIKRTPLLPQWAINEIVATIERVFKELAETA